MPVPTLSRYLLSVFLLSIIPHVAHAEAFKGGLLPSGPEKSIFFVFLVIYLLIIALLAGLLKEVYKWLKTGETEQLARSFGKFILFFVLITFALIYILIS